MAKIENAKHTDNFTDKGTMPKDMLKRHKLLGNMETTNYSNRHNINVVAKSARALKTYRMLVHGSMENKLPSSLRQSVHYFLTPMTRSDSDNGRDRRGLEPVAKVETEVLT